MRILRSITVGKKEIKFNEGFINLHTETYQNNLNRNNFETDNASESIGLTTLLEVQNQLIFELNITHF